MTDTTDRQLPDNSNPSIVSAAQAVETTQDDVSKLLARLQDTAPRAEENRKPAESADLENQLAMVRLGIATSLFYSLRTKHAKTAEHSLRVAIICSAWAERMGLSENLRNQIEVAALLHDLGKIGIPDRILRKPSELTVDEQLTMDCCPELAVEILRGCTSDQDLLAIVRYANAWYDSRRQDESPRGDALPLGSRMLVIANAFDSMTTEHVYRSALSRERAVQQLLEGGGSQFDPDLVVDFARMLEDRPEMLHSDVVDRWLQNLKTSESNGPWTDTTVEAKRTRVPQTVRRETRFHMRLLTDLKDGVAFTDSEGTVTHWNATMARLTGISTDAMVGQTWNVEAVGLRDKNAKEQQTDCPLADCFASSAPISRSMALVAKGSEPIPVHLQVSPVSSDGPGMLGAVIVLHDNTVRSDLEEQLETLHQKTTLDGLTGIANRAHFDEVLEEMTAATSAGGKSFSLVICDIDHFKRVNDVHGHPAGDEAIVQFAAILKDHSRDGDLVARYGGEEFVLLASNCDNATAAKRAEAIRQALEDTPLPSLGGKCVTASFGVTEYQAGDSAKTVLSRSDRALLKAKDNGRNRVVQLGTGKKPQEGNDQRNSGWFGWFGSSDNQAVSEFDILTPVPANLAIEKLKGFIADHDAEIINVHESQVSLKISALSPTGGRRRVDQRFALNVKLTLSPPRPEEIKASRNTGSTVVHVELSPLRKKDRRDREFQGCVDLVVSSLRSYLMGEMLIREE